MTTIKWLTIFLILCAGTVWGDLHVASWTATELEDTYINQNASTTNYGSADTLRIGKTTAPLTRYRSAVFRFPGLLDSMLCDTAHGTNRTFYLEITCDTATDAWDNNDTLYIYALREGRDTTWTESGATWNTYDGSNAWGTVGCLNTTTDIYPLAVKSLRATSFTTGGVFGFELYMLADSVSHGSWRTESLIIAFGSSGEIAHIGTFYSSEHATSALRPKLVYWWLADETCIYPPEPGGGQVIIIGGVEKRRLGWLEDEI